jgi:predicted phosphodiesterase
VPQIAAPARIGLLADFHGSSKRPALGLFCAAVRPDLLIVAGDLQDYDDWPVPTLFVRGNHEHYATIDAIAAGTLSPRNLHYLPDGEIVEVAGLRIAGIGGISRTSPGPKRLSEAAADWLSRQGDIDIVVSHDAPIRYGNRPELTNEYLRTVAECAAPKMWLSGHHHHFESERLSKDTVLLSVGKWPHQWVVADVGADRSITWERFRPDEAATGYSRRLPAWQQAAAAQMHSLRAAGAQ